MTCLCTVLVHLHNLISIATIFLVLFVPVIFHFEWGVGLASCYVFHCMVVFQCFFACSVCVSCEWEGDGDGDGWFRTGNIVPSPSLEGNCFATMETANYFFSVWLPFYIWWRSVIATITKHLIHDIGLDM